jgi:hypothetical protein
MQSLQNHDEELSTWLQRCLGLATALICSGVAGDGKYYHATDLKSRSDSFTKSGSSDLQQDLDDLKFSLACHPALPWLENHLYLTREGQGTVTCKQSGAIIPGKLAKGFKVTIGKKLASSASRFDASVKTSINELNQLLRAECQSIYLRKAQKQAEKTGSSSSTHTPATTRTQAHASAAVLPSIVSSDTTHNKRQRGSQGKFVAVLSADPQSIPPQSMTPSPSLNLDAAVDICADARKLQKKHCTSSKILRCSSPWKSSLYQSALLHSKVKQSAAFGRKLC